MRGIMDMGHGADIYLEPNFLYGSHIKRPLLIFTIAAMSSVLTRLWGVLGNFAQTDAYRQTPVTARGREMEEVELSFQLWQSRLEFSFNL